MFEVNDINNFLRRGRPGHSGYLSRLAPLNDSSGMRSIILTGLVCRIRENSDNRSSDSDSDMNHSVTLGKD
jgi:hypothetical protein